jgi:hypothetical protein
MHDWIDLALLGSEPARDAVLSIANCPRRPRGPLDRSAGHGCGACVPWQHALSQMLDSVLLLLLWQASWDLSAASALVRGTSRALARVRSPSRCRVVDSDRDRTPRRA